MNTIGSTLKAIREEKKLLLQDVANKTSINKTLLSRIETDNRMPTRNQVNLLCKYYKSQKNEIIIQWLSDKIVYEMQDEDLALTAMQVAEEKIKLNGHQYNIQVFQDKNEDKKIDDFINKVIQGDCLDEMRKLPDNSIDMILCDLPYGTTQH